VFSEISAWVQARFCANEPLRRWKVNDRVQPAAERSTGRHPIEALGPDCAADVADFLASPWLAGAARLGWSNLHLFGAAADRRYTRIDGLGPLPALGGCQIVALSFNEGRRNASAQPV
jgi:hypothetical protein